MNVNLHFYAMFDNWERPWQRKMDMRFGTWNVRNLYRAGALGLVTSEIEKYRMDLVGVQEVTWEGSVTLESGNYTLFYGVMLTIN